jgi:histone-arginine methyltransferase CARM1
VVDAFDPRLLVAPSMFHVIDFTMMTEEQFYEIDIPLKFTASVCTRIHGLACWFDVLFDGRYQAVTIYMFSSCAS